MPHDILLREARRLGHPLWLLRLSLATYKLARVLRVGAVVSRLMWAIRGITAGSGLATTELRVLMIHVVDVAYAAHPTVTPSLYVDDLSAEATGPATHVTKTLAEFTLKVCDALTKNRLQLSDKKSICTASSDSIGLNLEKRLGKYGITYHRGVKSLGAGLGAGCRRNTQVSKKRLKDFSKRLHRFARLDRAGFNTSRILRTGGTAGMVYGGGPQGVSCTTLRGQRRAAAAASAHGGNRCGQQLDAALLMGDGSENGRADPAFEAHEQPLKQWAQAVWEEWLPHTALNRMAAQARRKLASAKRIWAACAGPGTGLVATAPASAGPSKTGSIGSLMPADL